MTEAQISHNVASNTCSHTGLRIPECPGPRCHHAMIEIPNEVFVGHGVMFVHDKDPRATGVSGALHKGLRVGGAADGHRGARR
jgi:hypothetical protein